MEIGQQNTNNTERNNAMDTLTIAVIGIGTIAFIPLLISIASGIAARRRARRSARMMERFWASFDSDVLR
jgi:hypothetical protein